MLIMDAAEPQMICQWEVPSLEPGVTHALVAQPGKVTAIVGANGSGKSALGHWLEAHAGGATVRRLIAHRRLWFESAGPDITPASRENLQSHMTSWSRDPNSRWLDHAQQQRPNAVLFDLLGRVNERNARVAAMVDQGTVPPIGESVEPSLLTQVNRILQDAHLDVELALTSQATFDAVSITRSVRYPISQMSDGEKSALLLAAEVMVGPEGCVQIIDEPERHLHRSISAGLIEAILSERSDCHFVVLTHDLDLASNLPRDSTKLEVLSGCSWSGASAVGWDLREVDPSSHLPDSARRAILGGRKKILFLEGESHSLDVGLYSILYPGWHLSPVGGCEQVIRSVTGLGASDEHHWIHPRGIVDGDGRTGEEKAALSAKGVLALQVQEVESLYYCKQVLERLATQQAIALDRSAQELLDAATAGALRALNAADTAQRLAAAVSVAIVRRSALERLPDVSAIASGGTSIDVSVPSPYPGELASLQHLLADADVESIIRRFPVRDTALPSNVATALGFRTSKDYEAAVRSRLRRDAELTAVVRSLVGELP